MSVVVEREITRDQLERLRGKLKAESGIGLVGDIGTFDEPSPLGRVAGSYSYDGHKLVVNVTKHPPFMGRTVEGKLNAGLNAAVQG